jgi:sulfonate transport system permease protein
MSNTTEELRRDSVGAPTIAPSLDLPSATHGLVRPVVKRQRQRSRRASLGLRLVLPAFFFALWWILTGTGVITSFTFASPGATWHAFVQLLLHQDLLGDVGISAARAAMGLLVGGSVGLILGVTVGLFRLGEELIDSSMQMLRTLPFPALIFLFIFWYGIGNVAKVLLIALAALVPMYLNTSNAVRNVDRRVVEAARTFGLKGWRLVRQVIIPLALPGILNGLRFAAGISVVALVFAETIAANMGIGYLVTQASSLQQIPTLVVCIIIYALLGIGADVMVRVIERYSTPWRRHLAVR